MSDESEGVDAPETVSVYLKTGLTCSGVPHVAGTEDLALEAGLAANLVNRGQAVYWYEEVARRKAKAAGAVATVDTPPEDTAPDTGLDAGPVMDSSTGSDANMDTGGVDAPDLD